MTQAALQAFLINDLKTFLKDVTFENNSGEQTPVNIFYQDVPAQNKYEEQTQNDNFPFIVVEMSDGVLNSVDDPHTVNVNFITGTVEQNSQNSNFNGHLDVFSIINKILEYLTTKSSFDNKYTLNYPVKWSVTPDENAEPYYYGAVEASFYIPSFTQYTH